MSNPHNEAYKAEEYEQQKWLDKHHSGPAVDEVTVECKYAVIEAKSGSDLEKRMNDMAKRGWRLREIKTDSIRLVAVMEMYE